MKLLRFLLTLLYLRKHLSCSPNVLSVNFISIWLDYKYFFRAQKVIAIGQNFKASSAKLSIIKCNKNLQPKKKLSKINLIKNYPIQKLGL